VRKDTGVPQARLALDRAFTVGPVPSRLFGSFVEHMGRCVYTGIYEPDHPRADADGLRGDVLELTRAIGPTLVRYPGGNFVSGYAWEDGVGPQAQRPRRLDRAWRSVETNRFGLGEFATWADRAGVEVMAALNLGTRGVQEACDLLEYANHPSGTRLSDLRRSHGRAEPFGIRAWCLGNELDGPWQLGHKTAREYGRLAAETARAMRTIDPSVELVACGSSGSGMPTFGSWEREVLEEAYDQVDLVSAHAYYEEVGGDLGSFLASAVDMDRVIEAVVATVDAVRARGRHRKRVGISFDEWNVWYQSRFAEAGGAGALDWAEAPRLIEDEYSITDAVVVGTLLNSLLRHCDRVAIACQAQLVNVIGLIRAEPGGPAWMQTVALPFTQVRRLAVGTSLQVAVASDRHETARYGDVDTVDAAATWDDEAGLALFLVNRDPGTEATVDVRLGGFGDLHLAAAQTLCPGGGLDRHATNTAGAPDRVRSRPLTDVTVDRGTAHLRLPPLSWSAVRLLPGEHPVGPSDRGR
jgi:alpha-L-arabinofuranosidase